MKKILFIHQSADLYGSDKTILLYISNLDKSKYRSIVILPFEGPLKIEFEKNGIEVVICPVLKLYRKMISPINLIRFVREYFEGQKILNALHKKHHFDLVYSHTLASLIGYFFAKKENIKHLWHVQEIISYPKIFNWGFGKILSLKRNNIIVYDSEETMKFWINTNPKLKAKSEFVWNALDINEVVQYKKNTLQKIREEYFNANKQTIVIGLFGRINSWKGQQLLLKAYNKIENKKNLKLVYLGSAPPNQEHFEIELKDEIKNLNLESSVIIIPFQNEVWKFWQAIDIAVVPSTEPEPFGMVAIEAMYCGKPVVAANHGGLTETVLHNETGYLFKPNDADDLYNYLNKLIENENQRLTFGQKGNKRVCEYFTIDKHIEKFEQIFSKIAL